MMHKAWSSIEEVPYCFSRSSIKFQGHIALKIVEFDSNWAFPDCNSSWNSPMAMKCCTKLETAKKRCPIVFQGHPSNFKVIRDKTSPILTQIGRFRTIGRSQLSNPSDLPCLVSGLTLLWLWLSSVYGLEPIDFQWPHFLNGCLVAILHFSVSGWHGFGSVTQVCFGISVSNFMCMSFVAVGRRLKIVSYVTFKMAALWFWTMFNCNPPIAHCHPLLWGGGILVDHWSTISSYFCIA